MFSFIKDNVVKHTITYLGFTKWTEIVGHLDMVKVTETWDGRSIFLTEFVFDLKASACGNVTLGQQHSTLESLPSV